MLRPRWLPFALLVGFVVALAAWPTGAAASPERVVVAQIQGDDDGAVNTAIRAAIGSSVTVVAKREVSKAEAKLRLSATLTDREAARLIAALDAGAVIKGTLEAVGDKSALHLKLYLKGTARPKAFTLAFSNIGSEKFRTALKRTLLDRLGVDEVEDTGDDTAGGSDAAPTSPSRPTRPPPTPDGSDQPGDDGAGSAAGSGPGSGPGSGDDSPLAPPKHPPPAAAAIRARTANRDAFRLDLGASVTARSLGFGTRDFPQAPKNFSSAAVPGVRAELELYPFAFGDPHRGIAGLGLVADFDRTVSLTLRSTLANGDAVNASATQQRFSVGPRFRHVFGHRPTSASIAFGVSYGEREFVVDRSALATPTDIDIPDVHYKSIQPVFAARVPVAASAAFILDARAVFATSAGPVEDADQYGPASVTGGQVAIGLDITIHDRFAIKLEGDFAQMSIALDGTGRMANSRDGDASTIDVGGMTDRYFGGALSLGVLY